MDWGDWLGLGMGMHFMQKDRELQKKKQAQRELWHIFTTARFEVQRLLLTSWSTRQEFCANYFEHFPELSALLPLFPVGEVLSLQGYIGEEQRALLQEYLSDEPDLCSKFNTGQIIRICVDREGPYQEWKELIGIDEESCGRLWQVLIEMVLRCDRADRMDEIVEYLIMIFHSFASLEGHGDDFWLPTYYQDMTYFNEHSERLQNTPYLHAVLLLQSLLAERSGGNLQDYAPKLSDDSPEMLVEDEGCYFFQVYYGEEPLSIRTFAVRKTEGSGPDRVWELPSEDGKLIDGPPVLFFEGTRSL